MNFLANNLLYVFTAVTLFEAFIITKIFLSKKKSTAFIIGVITLFSLTLFYLGLVADKMEEKALVLKSQIMNNKIDSKEELRLYTSKLNIVRALIAQNHKTSLSTIKNLLNDEVKEVRSWAESNLQARKIVPYEEKEMNLMAVTVLLMIVSFLLPLVVVFFGVTSNANLILVVVILLGVMANCFSLAKVQFSYNTYFLDQKDYVYSKLLEDKKLSNAEIKQFADSSDVNIIILIKNISFLNDENVKFLFKQNPNSFKIQAEMIRRKIPIEVKPVKAIVSKEKELDTSVDLMSF